mmetsp:Transcript_1505/g.2399  ORF Transcript_1505/g.2399 Transcript_1505/m.2399 type:complete len:177 (-) Transcript_1505:146-676(-)|eukprot:CAMPEP_0196811658 /NCGR_PEP_ID=MMETSP1362-20130617/19655_1 /TAXON_ID=163516 /ORGANISM="Leptocylindrus danicus, Strain CCMP1856" /LENGTH=176 /DNA_ID=CAMNT_0042187023 /DNA_START=61 /DNA_END=591 /DNA_ORIENTATION=-
MKLTALLLATLATTGYAQRQHPAMNKEEMKAFVEKMKDATPEERIQMKREFRDRHKDHVQNLRAGSKLDRMQARPDMEGMKNMKDMAAIKGFDSHEDMMAFREKMRNATPEERKQMRKERMAAMKKGPDAMGMMEKKMMDMGMTKEELRAFNEKMRNAMPGDRKDIMKAHMEKFHN